MTQWVSFSAEINQQTSEALIATLAAFANQGETEVNLLFSTPGGAVMNGMNIYNVAKGMPFKLTIWNVGNVDSIGNLIFMAGHERYAAPLSTFMFHGVAFVMPGGQNCDGKFLRERLDSLEADEKRIGAVFEGNTTLNEGDVLNLFKEAKTKDAAWARSVGIVHAIREPQIAFGTPIHSLVFQR